jgi:HlyD family secretion protein
VLAVFAVLCAAYGGVRWWRAPRDDTRDTVLVSRGDIVVTTRVTGRIVPREEVFVRSLVAGVLDELKVRPGDIVRRGDHLATVRVIADPVMLSEARAQVTLAEDRVKRAQRELERVRPSNKNLALSGREIALAEDDQRMARAELQFARERLELVAHGAAAARGARSTRVLATIDGTVLAIPVAVGDVIGDTNSYRDGTTLAVIADMTQLLFKGQVEEAYVGKLKLGMPVEVRIGALDGATTSGTLGWIAPRASVDTGVAQTPQLSVAPLGASTAGVTRYEVWIELAQPPAGVRAGYSAAAEFTLDARKGVITLEERALLFEGENAYVQRVTKPGDSERRPVQLGLSDGVRIEVLSGLEPGDRVRHAGPGGAGE